MSTTAPENRLADVASEVFTSAGKELALASSEMPAAVRENFETYRREVYNILAAGSRLQDDLAEIREKADLMPVGGVRRLQEEAREAARNEVRSAAIDLRLSYVEMEKALEDAALPKLDPTRESLARETVRDALTGKSDSEVFDFAKSGPEEAVAVLLSDWGHTFVKAQGHDADRILGRARRVVALSAADRATNTSQVIASQALQGLGRIQAARGAAESFVFHVVEGGSR